MTTHFVLQTDSTGNLSTAEDVVRSSPDSTHGTKLDVKKLCLNTHGNNDFHCLVSVGPGDPLYQPDNPNITNVRSFVEDVKGMTSEWETHKENLVKLSEKESALSRLAEIQEPLSDLEKMQVKNTFHGLYQEILGKCRVDPAYRGDLGLDIQCRTRSTKFHCNATNKCSWHHVKY